MPSRFGSSVLVKAALLAAVALPLAGCDALDQLFSNSLLDPSQPSMPFYSRARQIGLREAVSLYDEPLTTIPKNAVDPSPEDLDVRPEDYRVAPGDTVRVEIWELFEVNQPTAADRRVSDTGYIRLPRLPQPVFVAGKTERQIEADVAAAYKQADILRDPQISTAVLDRANQTFTLFGAFFQPGTYNFRIPAMRMLQAIGMGAGVSNATLDYLIVIRGKEPEFQDGVGPAIDSGTDATAPAPLPLPNGGAAPLPLPGGNGQNQSPAAAAPANPPANDDAMRDLRQWRPNEMPPRQPADAAPLTKHNGMPASPVDPYAGHGYWVRGPDGKWTQVRPQTPEAACPPGAVPAVGQLAAEAPRVIRISLKDLKAGDPRWNIVVRNNDVIVAATPIEGEFYVMGNVNAPGVYSLTNRRVTITQAIAAARGFGPLAVPYNVQLIRRIDETREHMQIVNLDQIFRGKADDIVLKPNDVIVVGTAVYAPFLAVIRNAFRLTYGVGFVYDRNFADIDSFSSRNNPRN